MPALTVPTINKYKRNKQRREIRDTLAPGLRLVIQPSGARSWAVRLRRPDGRPGKLTLGVYVDQETADAPVLGAALTLGQARELAARIVRQRKLGQDVIQEYKANQARQRTEHATRTANAFGLLLPQFVHEYRTKHRERPRRWRGDARLLGLAWEPGADPSKTEPQIVPGSLAQTWADKAVASIDGHEVYAVVNEARKRSDGRARKMHSCLSVLFSWLMRHRKVSLNPCAGVWHPGAPKPRERTLADSEIIRLWHATDQIDVRFGAVIRVLLLTGARLNEVNGMRRSELSEDGTWTIPSSRTKNHRAHMLALPKLARDIIAAVPHIEGDLVFSTGRAQISGWSTMKRQLDAAMGDVPPWRIHDLRRTCASGLQRLGVRTETIERALNHISGSFRGVAGTYQRDPMTEEVKAALARWAQHVAGLVSGEASKVVALRP